MDANLVLRDGSANLTATETLTAVTVGPMHKPLWLYVLLPAVNAGTVTVKLAFKNGATEYASTSLAAISAAGLIAVPFFTNQPSVVVSLTLAGGANACGAAKVWIEPAGMYTAY
jgi:hypothetical protein